MHYRQEDLAELLKVKKNTISNYENSVSEPSFDQLYILIKIFDISAHDFLFSDLSKGEVSIIRQTSTCLHCKDKDKTIWSLEKTISILEKINKTLEESNKGSHQQRVSG